MGGGRKDGPRVIHLTGSLIWLLREQFSCCGYFLLNETTIETVGFCADPNNVNRFNPNNTDQFRCVGPITSFTDFTLNNVFSYVPSFCSLKSALPLTDFRFFFAFSPYLPVCFWKFLV